MRPLHAALTLFAVFLLGVWSAETILPAVRLRQSVMVIGPNGRPADGTDRMILHDTCEAMK